MTLVEKIEALNKSLSAWIENNKLEEAYTEQFNSVDSLRQKITKYLEQPAIEKKEQTAHQKTDVLPRPIPLVLLNSVGNKAHNAVNDVRLVQTLLAEHNFKLQIDGLIGPKTIAAIKVFQTSIGFQKPDGCVDPNGRTWKQLIKSSKEETPQKDRTNKNRPIKKQEEPAVEVLPKTWDHHTDRRITSLDSRVQGVAVQFINQAFDELGIKLRVTSALRTIAEQNELFKGGKVTKVPGGRSYHNYGLAIDVVEIKDGKALYSNPKWKAIAAIGKQLGFEWGGDWKSFVDKPHFQMTFGLSTLELMQKNYPNLYTERYVGKKKAAPISKGDNTKQPNTKNLKAAVGKGSPNHKSDVQLVQEALNKHGFKTSVDGSCGAQTIKAITEFQRMLGFRKPDARVDPGGKTWQKLQAKKFNATEFLKDADDTQRALAAHAIDSEGGYSNHPNDTGGKTMYGIAEHKEWPKFARLFKLNPKDTHLIKDISKEQASAYYLYSRYDKYGLGAIKSKRIVNALFDQSILTPNLINKHTRAALNDLGATNIPISSQKLDAEAVDALNKSKETDFIKAFIQYQNTYYEDVAKEKPKKAAFLKGWKNRTARL